MLNVYIVESAIFCIILILTSNACKDVKIVISRSNMAWTQSYFINLQYNLHGNAYVEVNCVSV